MRLRPHILLCCVLALPGAERVVAQGTSGMLPAPISGRDLDIYGETLQLTREQRDAIDAVHGTYLDEFRRLRETEMAAYMEEIGGMWRRGFRSLNQEAIERSIQSLDRLMRRIRLVDEGLFDGIQSVLTDEQATKIARVMQTRDRQRYRSGGTRMVGFVNRASRVDLARLYAGLDLSEQEREATDPFILQYEGRLSAETRALYEATTRMFLTVVESLEEQGVNFEDPASMMQNPGGMREAMQTAFAEAVKKPRERASAISDLNRRTLRQVGQLMQTASATRFRDRYLRRAYAEVPRTSASATNRSYQAVLNQRDLPDSVRADVKAAAADYRATRLVVVEEMIDEIDDFRRNWSPMGGRGGADTVREEHAAKLEQFRERLATIDKTALETLYAMVDDGLAETVRTAVAAGDFEVDDEDGRGPAGAGFGVAAAGVRDGGAVAPPGPDPYLPTPITRRDIAGYRDRLGLGDSDWFVLQSLHEEYVGKFNRIRETDIAAVRAAERAMKPAGDDEDAAPPSSERIDALYDLRAEAMRSIRQIDGLFFDDLETLLASPEQQPDARRLRLARERFVYNRGLGGSTLGTIYGGGDERRRRGQRGGRRRGRWSGLADTATREGAVDVGRLVDELNLGDEQRAECSKLLVEYGTAARDGFRRQYETQVKLRREAAKLRAQMRRGSDDDDEDRRRRRNRWQAYRDLVEGDGRKADEARSFMVELNRATLAAVADSLTADDARALTDLYNRTAFPEIYDNPRAAGRYLAAALELTDLDERQRARVESIYAEYEPEHRRVADLMREVYAAPVDMSGEGRDRWRGYQERRNTLAVLEFDRREVNDKAFRQLRDVLTDEQEARLRLPADRRQGDDDPAI